MFKLKNCAAQHVNKVWISGKQTSSYFFMPFQVFFIWTWTNTNIIYILPICLCGPRGSPCCHPPFLGKSVFLSRAGVIARKVFVLAAIGWLREHLLPPKLQNLERRKQKNIFSPSRPSERFQKFFLPPGLPGSGILVFSWNFSTESCAGASAHVPLVDFWRLCKSWREEVAYFSSRFWKL